MTTNEQPKVVYYKAGDDVQINDLPFFFGWVEIQDGKIAGEHYKPKEFDGAAEKYSIGYYKIEGNASDFLQTFETHLTEITQEDFNAILSKWTKGGEYSPTCWGLAWSWKIASSRADE